MALIRISERVAAPGIVAAALMAALAAWAVPATGAPKDCRGKLQRSDACTTDEGNLAPVISGTPAAAVTVNQSYSFTPTASDPEGAAISFSISNQPPWATFSKSTGRLSGTPSDAAIGEHVDIVIAVSDGALTAALPPFSIVVSAENQAPVIGGTPATSAREGQAYYFRPTASDPDGDTLKFSISNRPSWATFGSATGRLSGTPPAGSVGTYRDIVIRVSDGQLTATLPAFSISVDQVALGSATLSWVAPTQREDGSVLENLAGYRIRYGNSPGSYPNLLQIPNPGITSCVIENLPAGTYYFVATAYDASGSESEYSAVVSKPIG
jgi:hypothetical protein